MTKAKIAISIDSDLLADVRRHVASGRAASVSAYIEEVVAGDITDDDDWDAYVDRRLATTGGPLTADELAWVEAAVRGEAGDPPSERMKT